VGQVVNYSLPAFVLTGAKFSVFGDLLVLRQTTGFGLLTDLFFPCQGKTDTLHGTRQSTDFVAAFCVRDVTGFRTGGNGVEVGSDLNYAVSSPTASAHERIA